MSIKHWPAQERPREKLAGRGAQALSDAELLAIFLGSGVRGEDAVSRARRLLQAHGSLRGLLQALGGPPARRLQGLGAVAACRLQAAAELGNRCLQQGLERGEALTDPGSASRLFVARLRPLGNEAFAVAFLDSRHRLIAFEVLFQGTIDGAEVHPRVVVQRCLERNAAAVLVGHNHPSGVAEPSAADRHLTLRLRDALALVDVRLLDHLVVGDGPPVSMAARGWV
ncbi:RadC family protein [Pseudomarimonas salicorniae]|uniref:DNA repair protein RadC n=1 Tax=Pseudomarimonas salicorniae TaxID=2933270 RepID=A0ABT0GDB5_9GAMM|nr:DNA repair protein RadC [Lysobacter sp. CAU 1642]MCK7592535.1 DNA repair protein RadC [Lysobacter sp. CAU 1642]